MFDASPTDADLGFYLPILSPPARSPINVVALSPLEGFYTHFVGRTRACPGAGLCRLCEIGRGRRYSGYFAVQHSGSRWLLRLTAEAALRMAAWPPKAGMAYRVESVSVRRPLQISFIEEISIPAGSEVSEKELLAVVMALHGLGLPDLSLDVDGLRDLVRSRAIALINREALALS